MFFPELTLTRAGAEMIVNALAGDSITFTKISIGNGAAPADIRTLPALISAVQSSDITSITKGDRCVSLQSTFTNSEINTGYFVSEIGVFAKDSQNNEVLYAYANSADKATYMPAYADQALFQTTFNILAAIGDAATVNAVLGEYSGFATKDEFNSHKNSKNNPHNVTKSQVGLGNVPNVSTDNQTPTVQSNTSQIDISNGDTLSVIVTKIRNAINKLKSHISDKNNPHNVTAAQIGAACKNHSHDVDILSSVLKVKKSYNSLFEHIDFNSFRTPGLYDIWTSSAKNKPSGCSGESFLIVIGASDSTVMQIVFSAGQITSSPEMYMRKYNGNEFSPNWQPWSSWNN